MAKELNGAELAGFIKERQLKQVRNLRQEHKIVPKLLIIKSIGASDVIDTYIRMKQRYAEDILIETEVLALNEGDIVDKIHAANIDSNVYGIIVQLPLLENSQIDKILGEISPEKDVDGLGGGAHYPSATAEAVDWLLTGYGIELEGKNIAILGRGRLVGAPLEAMWRERGLRVVAFDIDSGDIRESVRSSDIVVTATGVPGRLTSADVGDNVIVVDAGTASEGGVIVGDASDDLRARQDVTITPVRGGVGPLTIAVLFDHVIQAALKKAGKL